MQARILFVYLFFFFIERALEEERGLMQARFAFFFFVFVFLF